MSVKRIVLSLLCVILGATVQFAGAQQISLWVGFTDAPRAPAWQHVVEKFNSANASFKVNYRTLPENDADTMMRTSFAAGNPPDLFIVDGYMRLFLLKPRLDISDWVEKYKDRFVQSDLWAAQIDGKYNGIPLDKQSCSQIMVNTKLLQKLGLPTTWSTWSQFLDLCEKIKQHGIIPIAHGNKDLWPGTQSFMVLLSQTCPPAKLDGLWKGGTKWTDPDVVKAAELYKMLSDKGYLTPGAAGISWSESKMYFYGGRAAMWQGGSWMIGDAAAEAPQFDFDVVRWPPPIPGGHGSSKVLAGGTTEVMGVAGLTKSPDACKAFLEFITRPEVSVPLNSELKMISSFKGATTPEIVGPRMWKVAEIANNSPDGTIPFYETVVPPGVGEEAFWTACQDVLTGAKTPLDAMKTVQTAAEKAGIR